MSAQDLLASLADLLSRARRRCRVVIAIEIAEDGTVVVEAPSGWLAVPAQPFAVPAMRRMEVDCDHD